jgi:hypothetical protein
MIPTNEGGEMHNVVMPQMIGGVQATSARSVGSESPTVHTGNRHSTAPTDVSIPR